MHKIKILSDYSSIDNPNFLVIIRDDQGDIHINIIENDEDHCGIRIVADGTRHSVKVRQAFYALIEAYEKELNCKTCHTDISKLNGD